MKKCNNIIMMLFIACAITSCSESLLEKGPIGDFTSSDYLTTAPEAESAIFGLYDAVQSAYNGNSWNSPMLVYQILGDGVNAGGGGPTDQSQLQAFDRFKHGAENPAVASVFHDYYTFITSANTILETLSDDVSNAEQVKGEAYFFRAFAYFHLVRAWGGVPLYTTNPTVLTEGAGKSDPATIYAQIEKDLNSAIANLPVKKSLPEGQKFRVAQGAAQALLGKVLLYQKKYSEAAQAFSDVINSEEYDLVEDFTTIWDPETRAGDEVLFELLYSSSNSVDWGGPWDGTAESNFVNQLCGPRDAVFGDLDAVNATFAKKKADNIAGFEYKITDLNYGWGFLIPTKKIGSVIYDNAGVERISGTVISAADYVAAGGSIKVESPDDYPAYEEYMRLKFATRKAHTSDGGVTEVNYQTPFKLIRFADVLLMAAEAYNKSGNDTEAVKYIKRVRARAGFSNYSDFESLTGNALFEYIVKERTSELAFEGHRFFDLVRWGKAATELGSSGFQSNKNELLPIPQSEFNKNSELDPAVDQNPGY